MLKECRTCGKEKKLSEFSTGTSGLSKKGKRYKTVRVHCNQCRADKVRKERLQSLLNNNQVHLYRIMSKNNYPVSLK